MTTTLNGNRTIPSTIEPDTLVIEASSGREARFEGWVGGGTGAGACANVRFVTTGGVEHVCSFTRTYLLPPPTVDEQDAADTRSLTEYREQAAIAGQRIADLVREKTNAEVQVEALRAENERMANTIVELREHVELRTNEEPPFLNKLVINHALPMLVDGEPAMQWIAARFNAEPTTPNCGQF